MIILKEEKQINRPFLYLTGGLVLGETMALWMTVKQEVFWLAVWLPVFFCVFIYHDGGVKRGGENGRGRRSAFFLVAAGVVFGILRMEFEERMVSREESVILDAAGKHTGVSGKILEIQENEYGLRLLLGDCLVDARTAGKQKIRRMYGHVDADPNLKIGMEVYIEGKVKLPDPDRNPGQFDYRLYCLSKGVAGILSGGQTVIVDSRCLTLQEGFRQIGLHLGRQLDEIAGEKDAGLLKAILLGNKTDMDGDVYELYRRNGISHVLAISGLHVSVIGMGLWKGLRALGAGYWSSGILAFSLLFCFGSVAGFGPSVVRAVFMMGISFLAGGTGRTYDLPSAMCVPAVGLMIRHPYLLTQASFQLSFLAVGAICFPGRVLVEAWKVQGIRQSILMAASIQMVTIPVVLFHSFEIPLYGLLLNLFVVPLMAYVLVSGMLGLAGSFLRKEIGILFLGGAHYILGFYEAVCRGAEGLHGARLILGRPEIREIVLYYGCLLAGTWLSVKKARGWLILWLAGVLFLVPVPERELSVTFLDVGQGDGIFIEHEGKAMLVDCGSSQEPAIGEDCLVPFLMSQGISRLDTVVVSHGDQDHVSGVKYLLETAECGIEIGCLVMPEAGCEDETIMELESLAHMGNIPVIYAGTGDRLSGILGDDVDVICLYPEKGMRGKDRNDSSLVLKISYGNFSVLLTGDVGTEGELVMAKSGELMPVTVLKAAHHGSASSTCQEFLDLVWPAYVVFSSGRENRYGHPSEQVVERCRESGAGLFETARRGAIKITTDGVRVRAAGWLDRQGGI